jgi:hypothetical protein
VQVSPGVYLYYTPGREGKSYTMSPSKAGVEKTGPIHDDQAPLPTVPPPDPAAPTYTGPATAALAENGTVTHVYANHAKTGKEIYFAKFNDPLRLIRATENLSRLGIMFRLSEQGPQQ